LYVTLYAGTDVLLSGTITLLSSVTFVVPLTSTGRLSFIVVLLRSSTGATGTKLPLSAGVLLAMSAGVLAGTTDELSGTTWVVVADGNWLFEDWLEPVHPSVKKTPIRTSTDSITKLLVLIIFTLNDSVRPFWRRIAGRPTALISLYYHTTTR
jgi:hypothetical protein